MIYTIKKLGGVLERVPKSAGILTTNYLSDGKYPIVDQGQSRIAGYTNDSSRIYRGGLPVVIFGDHTRSLKFIDFPFAVGADGTKVLKPISDIDAKYLYYFLQSIELPTRGYARHFSLLKDALIPLPPVEEQREIIARIEKQFAKIDETARLCAESEALADQLLPAALHEIFSSTESKGWDEKKLEKVCQKVSNIKWDEHKNESFKYIDLTSVSREDSVIYETKEINSEDAPSRAKQIVESNDVIFGTTRPTLMRVTIIPHQYNKQICSTGFAVLRSKDDLILPRFIFYFIKSNLFMDRMEQIQTGASYPAVSDTKVLETKIPLPSLAEQEKIIKKLDALSEKTYVLASLQSSQSADLKALKQSILHEAFAVGL